ncbi:MAG TPA: hydrogenase maturation nickel metallochaperone HypA [Candidatus Hydrogenedentes bacterium]|nr:hydrogenase maturation nickel metallochaperone HypA [Candidatus Hydrogenedentota bacterium]HNT87945.1 hydrogenase maturation nickel metallochaperone HypA [Candidatus Hydrogenedentota bacterium]
MHEFSIVENILERALAIAVEHGHLPVSRVRVAIGALQQVEPEVLEFAFQAAVQGTLAEDAAFEWRAVPARIACAACDAQFEPEDLFWVCPECAAAGGRVLAGDELVLESVVLDET